MYVIMQLGPILVMYYAFDMWCNCTHFAALIRNISSSTLRQLYPETKPFQSGWLKVSNIHEIYFEQSGKKDGNPVVFVYVLCEIYYNFFRFLCLPV